MDNITIIIGSIYLFLPAGISNMAPVIANKLFGRGTPIDFGRKWHKKPIFGSHKTWQGLIAGTIVAWLFFMLQKYLYDIAAFKAISIIDYSTTTAMLGAAMGLGALLGDAIKSFFKRRASIKPGRPWIPFDQIDYIIGGLIFTMPFIKFQIYIWINIFISYFILHILVNEMGFRLKLKSNRL